ncbi:hypothetical protein [Haliangium sp.]|uniref:hypothetical protein n=1 Tax=Haliangium sp. TaxID=2663208 RepID=UPI003D0B4F69
MFRSNSRPYVASATHTIFLAGAVCATLGACELSAAHDPTPATSTSAGAVTVTALTYWSVGSGDFHDAAVWSLSPTGAGGAGVPGLDDTAHVQAGSVLDADEVEVDTLTIAASALLRSSDPVLDIQARTVTIAAGGEIRGLDDAHVYLGPKAGESAFSLYNDGLVRAGDDNGSIFVHSGEGDLPASTDAEVISTTGGTFWAGDPQGSVYVVAGTIHLDDSLVRAGSGAAPVDWLGNSRAGNVYLGGIDIDLGGTTLVESGSNTTAGGTGGSIAIIAVDPPSSSSNPNDGHLTIGANTTILAGSPTINSCPGTTLFAAVSSTILGTVTGVGGSGCVYWDPPALALAGSPSIEGSTVHIAGDSLDAGSLVSAGAVTATDHIELYVRPGGALDLTGLSAGSNYFSAGLGITIHANPSDILTDPGVSPAQLMNPAPAIVSPNPSQTPAGFAQHGVIPSYTREVRPGELVLIPTQLTNITPMSQSFTTRSFDTAGWSGPASNFIPTTLGAGETSYFLFSLTVPTTAQPGAVSDLVVEKDIAGNSLAVYRLSVATPAEDECVYECVYQSGGYTWRGYGGSVNEAKDDLVARIGDDYSAPPTPSTAMPGPRAVYSGASCQLVQQAADPMRACGAVAEPPDGPTEPLEPLGL